MASRSSAELAGKFYDLATSIPKANREAAENAALFAKEEFIKGGQAAGLKKGGSLPSSSKARWGARYDIKGFQNPSALVRYVGPVHWAFGGTSPHIIVARHLTTRTGARSKQDRIGAMAAFGGSNRGVFGQLKTHTRKGRARRGKRALTIPGAGTPKAYAFHPGHRGRNAWPIVQNRVRRGAPDVFAPTYRRAIAKAGFGR